jgi:hypothetical protein
MSAQLAQPFDPQDSHPAALEFQPYALKPLQVRLEGRARVHGRCRVCVRAVTQAPVLTVSGWLLSAN